MFLPVLALAVLAASLAACGLDPEYRARQAAAAQSRDDQACRSFGASPGTEPYVNCRLRLVEGRGARAVASGAAILTGLALIEASRPRPVSAAINCTTTPLGSGMTSTRCN